VANFAKDMCKQKLDFVGVSLNSETLARSKKRSPMNFYKSFKDEDGFRVFPSVLIPPTIQSKIKKIGNGTKLDGPNSLYQSDFLLKCRDGVE
jgi:hypothetical protein